MHIFNSLKFDDFRGAEPLKEERIYSKVHIIVPFFKKDVILQISNKVERTMDLPLYRDYSSTPRGLRNQLRLPVDL